MDKKSLEKATEILEQRKAEILNRTKNVDIDIDGDETDEIQGKIAAHVHNQILSRDKASLVRIDKALKKIEDGKFGSCEECEEPIGEKRLLINPEFNICISCAEANELRNKRFGAR